MTDTIIALDSVKLGADPELFIFDPSCSKYKSSIGMIGGSKKEPRKLNKGISVQEDNVLVEFNIPPASTKEQFIYNLQAGIFEVSKVILPNLELKARASAFLPMEELASPVANEFGCTPDYNAWMGGAANIPPLSPENGLRSAGFHVHVGYELSRMGEELQVKKEEINQNIVQHCDLFLAVPSIIMDADKHRRQLYGKAGAFRSKPYGVEYRVLSSFFLSSVQYMDWVYEQTMRAVKEVAQLNTITPDLGNEIQYVINNQDYAHANEMCKKYKLELA